MTKDFPTLDGMLKAIENKKKTRKHSSERANKLQKRQTYFCIGSNDIWRGKSAIHITINKFGRKHNITWLQISMSYHRFTNQKVSQET